jgi:sensor histidine kinase regulating citrate/malate metabolism
MVNHQHFLSIRIKLSAILILFLILTLGTLGLSLNALNTKTLDQLIRQRDQRFAKNVQQSINQVLFAGKYQAQAYVESLASRDKSIRYIVIIDRRTQRAIANSDPARVGARYDDPITKRGFKSSTSNEAIFQTFRTPKGESIL